jgi:hypothetical protein
VRGNCPCTTFSIVYNNARELATGPKAVLDAIRNRPAAVDSPPDPALTDAASAAAAAGAAQNGGYGIGGAAGAGSGVSPSA